MDLSLRLWGTDGGLKQQFERAAGYPILRLCPREARAYSREKENSGICLLAQYDPAMHEA